MRLDDRATDLPAEQGARLVTLGLLAEASTAAKSLAADAGDEPLHDFRVALRRLRSALRTFGPWLESDIRPRQEKKLKRIARSTNEARDAEVQLAWLATKRDVLAPARFRAGYDLVVARFEDRARRGPDAARVAERFRRAARKLERRLGAHTRKPAASGQVASFDAVLASLVRDQVRALCQRVDAIRDPSHEEDVHRARIEGKRLRYLLEPLRGHGRADTSRMVGHLKRLQDVLGDLHDAHVLAGELREMLAESAADRARQLHASVYGAGAGITEIRDRLRESPRPGILALVRLVRERRDRLRAQIERGWRAAGMDALVAEARVIATALEVPSGKPRQARRASEGRTPEATTPEMRPRTAGSASSASRESTTTRRRSASGPRRATQPDALPVRQGLLGLPASARSTRRLSDA